MPLPVLLVLVVGGISAIALLLHLSGRSELRFLTETDARGEWLRQYPETQVQSVTVALDGHAAVVRTDLGPGLVWSFGADTVARFLQDFDLVDGDDGLTIIFHDYTAPKVRLTLAPEERAAWAAVMQPQETPA